MKDLKNLVYKFMEREEITLKQAMLQSSLGMCAKTGDIAEIVRGVVYNGYPYTEERKKRNAEYLGEVLFYWIMMASTCDINPEQIIEEYINLYVQRMKITKEEEVEAEKIKEKLLREGNVQAQASILEMLKYVKSNELESKHPSLVQLGKHIKPKEKVREK